MTVGGDLLAIVVVGSATPHGTSARRILGRAWPGCGVLALGRARGAGHQDGARAGSSPWAQGGIAAAIGADDTPACTPPTRWRPAAGSAIPIVRVLTEARRACVERLVGCGARFDRASRRRARAGPRGGAQPPPHRPRRRRRHRRRDGAPLLGRVAGAGGPIRERLALAVDLVVDGGRVVGVSTGRRPAAPRIVAPAVVLATGGIGRLYGRHDQSPPGAPATAWRWRRAGRRRAGRPRVRAVPSDRARGRRDPMPLLTEALRGEGAVLVDETGERFMLDVHPDAELAPRDVVARAIWRAHAGGHRVFLDARALGERFAERFPTVSSCCAGRHRSRRRADPGAPARHYHMGGVMVDARAAPRSGPVGLRRGGRHRRARRQPAGQQLAARGRGVRQRGGGRRSTAIGAAPAPGEEVAPLARRPEPVASPAPGATMAPLRRAARAMWDRVGVVRDAAGLEARARRRRPSSASSASAASCATCSRPGPVARRRPGAAREPRQPRRSTIRGDDHCAATADRTPAAPRRPPIRLAPGAASARR